MAKLASEPFEFDDDSDELDVAEQLKPNTVAAVVSGTDWTTETIVSQLDQGNIQLNPSFQRRDAWKLDRKSRFIESLIVGLPIPQIVLAESKKSRGKFIVLDGKQRLLSILQFWGLGKGGNNSYRLSGLTLRNDLKRSSYDDLKKSRNRTPDYDALCNQPIRTIVIRNWKDTDFLHTVFLRLNTGSVKLSPQELRQALLPGAFATYIDEAAADSASLRRLLNLDEPDPRMRDIEILARFLGFRFFADQYPGRMKRFLDKTFETFNDEWDEYKPAVESAIADFEKGVKELLRVFGDGVARKPTSPQFNRAIFDALIFFASKVSVRTALKTKRDEVQKAYAELFSSNSAFVKAIESDTAGSPNTSARLRIWANTISQIAGQTYRAPRIPVASAKKTNKRRKKTSRSVSGD